MRYWQELVRLSKVILNTFFFNSWIGHGGRLHLIFFFFFIFPKHSDSMQSHQCACICHVTHVVTISVMFSCCHTKALRKQGMAQDMFWSKLSALVKALCNVTVLCIYGNHMLHLQLVQVTEYPNQPHCVMHKLFDISCASTLSLNWISSGM